MNNTYLLCKKQFVPARDENNIMININYCEECLERLE